MNARFGVNENSHQNEANFSMQHGQDKDGKSCSHSKRIALKAIIEGTGIRGQHFHILRQICTAGEE
jgi:hypothetical protein